MVKSDTIQEMLRGFQVVTITEIVAGVVLLAFSLSNVGKLISQLPPGKVHHRWKVLAVLIIVFIGGYAGYGVIFWDKQHQFPDLIVPTIFALGACFVFLTTSLSLQTAVDVRRVIMLERETITDALTGVYNRRFMERYLEDEFVRARAYAAPLSLLLIDVDHFKQINDRLGHLSGDLVIRSLCELVSQAVRQADIVVRYGGDELIVIAPNTPLKMAEMFAERLCRRIEAQTLTIKNNALTELQVNITVSIGVASVDSRTDTVEKLIHRVDQALYSAKQAGRNRVAAV